MKKILMTCAFAAAVLSAPAFAASDTAASDSGYRAIMDGKWGDAEKVLREGLKQNPNDATRLLNLALVLQRTGREAEAAGIYQQVLSLGQNPNVAVYDPYTLPKPERAKRLAKQGLASLDSQKR